MTVSRNGEVIKKIPVTTGKPGYDTRNGVKVVLAKEGTRSHDQRQHRHAGRTSTT